MKVNEIKKKRDIVLIDVFSPALGKYLMCLQEIVEGTTRESQNRRHPE